MDTPLTTYPQVDNLHNSVDYFGDFVDKIKKLLEKITFNIWKKCGILPKYV